MDLFPKSTKDIFRKRIIMKESDSGMIKTPSTKWRLAQLESATQHRTGDNETALEQEMEQTLGQMNHFLHRLEVVALVHDKSKTGKKGKWPQHQTFERHFKDQVVLGRTLMGKVKELLDLEDSGLRLARSFRSVSNRSSTSGVSVDNSSQESADVLSHSSRYSSEIKDVLRKLNHVLKTKAPTTQLNEFELEEESNVLDSLLPGSGRDSLQFLTERLAADHIQPTFRSLPPKPSDSSHVVSCRVFNITVEGQASEKVAAKKAAAVKMLERLVEDSIRQRLPPQVTPFTDKEIKDAVDILCETERYDITLAELCTDRRKLAPRYETDSREHEARVRCFALGLQGVGSHTNPTVAKRAAAREVLWQSKQKPKY